MKRIALIIIWIICLTSGLAQSGLAQSRQSPRRLLVVSGGGARGAWGVGIANLLDSTGKRYAHVIGTSTGSLMAPFILLRKFDALNRGYTSVSQKDIFNVNPFRKDGGIRILNALWRFGKPSIGTTENLRSLIKTFMTEEDYRQIRSSGNDFTVAVVNFRTLEPAYRSASQYPGYEDMVNWIWASANEPIFMSAYMPRDSASGKTDYWFDGGVQNVIPVRQGLQIALNDSSYTAVDVIVNNTPSAYEPTSEWGNKKNKAKTFNADRPNLLKMVIRTIDTYGSGTREMNITIGDLLDKLPRFVASPSVGTFSEPVAESAITLTFYFMPQDLFNMVPNELIFDKGLMNILFNAGRQGRYVPQPTLAMDNNITKEGTYSFKISRAGLRQLLLNLKP